MVRSNLAVAGVPPKLKWYRRYAPRRIFNPQIAPISGLFKHPTTNGRIEYKEPPNWYTETSKRNKKVALYRSLVYLGFELMLLLVPVIGICCLFTLISNRIMEYVRYA